MRRTAALAAIAVWLGLAAPALASTLQIGSKGPAVARLQRRLVALTYLDRHRVSGVFGYGTQQAVMAFQGWNGLPRDGIAGRTTRRHLNRAHVPHPWGRDRRHIEIHKPQQVMLLVNKRHRVIRAVHVSTAAPGHVTPGGHFRIYRREVWSWSRPFHVWMHFAAYFTGGFAIHEYPDVPGSPASHGCVRVASPDGRVVWRFDRLGTRVAVG